MIYIYIVSFILSLIFIIKSNCEMKKYDIMSLPMIYNIIIVMCPFINTIASVCLLIVICVNIKEKYAAVA